MTSSAVISLEDQELIKELRKRVENVDAIIPRITTSIRAINALGLNKKTLNTLETVMEACDACHEAVPYMPGNLIGFDKDDDLVFYHAIGQFDTGELVRCVKFSDLFVINIVGTYGMLEIVREKEKEVKKSLGTVVIIDLEGLSYFQLAITSQFNYITKMMQDMFPDIVRKLYIINAPAFIHVILKMILPVLAKQTRDKLRTLGSNYKEILREELGEEVLFEHWGGRRTADFVRKGRKLPPELFYNKSNDLDPDILTKLIVPSKQATFIPIKVEGQVYGRKLAWWLRIDSKDILFSILKAAPGREFISEHSDDYLVWPKFRIATDFVPESGEILAEEPGIYKFVFENDGYLWSKTVRYLIEVRT